MEEGGRGVSRLFCFGLGYSAEALARRLAAKGWEIAGTARDPAKVERLKAQGYQMSRFTGDRGHPELSKRLAGTTHLLLSIPPGHDRAENDGDPVLRHYRDDIVALTTLRWIGYLSTVGVYGDRAGARVDETTPPLPNSERTKARVLAESAWRALGAETGIPVQIFRLAGIYGPGRSALDKLRAGTARRVVKPGQVFSRIHVEDIAGVLEASMARPRAGAVYNVADDEPAPPDQVIAHAAELLGMEPPPAVPFEKAELSPMARSFYGDSRRVSNALIKSELGVNLAYPTYREGLRALKALPGRGDAV
jgi:nucleoside-diphosphate-sugar epimerase